MLLTYLSVNMIRDSSSLYCRARRILTTVTRLVLLLQTILLRGKFPIAAESQFLVAKATLVIAVCSH